MRPYSRRQAAGLDLDLLDEVEVERLAFVADLDAGRVEAVDDVLVLRAGRAVDHRPDVIFGGPRRNPGNGIEVAAKRNALEQIGASVDARHRRGRVDR